ncbi:RNA-directed DNA polymerase, eukaryota [Tanacetum coccineum]
MVPEVDPDCKLRVFTWTWDVFVVRVGHFLSNLALVCPCTPSSPLRGLRGECFVPGREVLGGRVRELGEGVELGLEKWLRLAVTGLGLGLQSLHSLCQLHTNGLLKLIEGPFGLDFAQSFPFHAQFYIKLWIVYVVFAKAYDSVRWDFLDDVLSSFGFGSKWRSWILGSLSSGKASVLVNGSPTSEFQFHCGLKQGDPLAPYLFLLIMESLHLSFARVVEAGIFKGVKISNSVTISHLFYADDAVFVGEWSNSNLSSIMNVLHCFSLASGLKINVHKSQLLGVGVSFDIIEAAAYSLGCSVMKTPFKYLGVPVGGNMSSIKAWDDIIRKIKSRLSKWKVNTLSIGGRLTLLKSVLGSTPCYWMSLFKVPKSVLATMEAMRREFFYGAQADERKIAWVKWSKVLSSKKNGGLGVSSFYALNRALLFKWVWRFISQDNSLWARVISAIHGPTFQVLAVSSPSLWNST